MCAVVPALGWSLVVRETFVKSARDQNKQTNQKKERNVCDNSEIMRQGKGATIIINKGPKEGVARRESRAWKGWWMNGWYGFRAQGIHNNGKREERSW